MQTEKSESSGQRIMPKRGLIPTEGERIMPETRFTEFSALSDHPRVGIPSFRHNPFTLGLGFLGPNPRSTFSALSVYPCVGNFWSDSETCD